jgi:hypothetical protein
MSSQFVHLQKLCVGADRVDDLIDWQTRLVATRRAQGLDPRPVHVTRSRPKRAEALLDGGSLYWVFKGLMLARQRIVALEPAEGPDGVTRCAIVLNPDGDAHRTRAAPAIPGLALPRGQGRAGGHPRRRPVRRSAAGARTCSEGDRRDLMKAHAAMTVADRRLDDVLAPLRDLHLADLLEHIARALDGGAHVRPEPFRRGPDGRVLRSEC